MIEIVREAGPLALLALGLFVMPGLLAVALQAALGHRANTAPGAWVAVFLPLGVGLYGYQRGMALVDAAVIGLEPRVSAALRAQGHHESMQRVLVGGTLTAVLVGLMVAATGLNMRMRQRARP